MISKTRLVRLWWLMLFVMVGLSAASYLFISRAVESTVTEELLNRERVVARAQASNVVSFFQVFGGSVALRARLRSMERNDATTEADLDSFVEQWNKEGLSSGVVLTDSAGIVRFNSNILGTSDTGLSLADRDYFKWVMGQVGEGDYFIGEPVVSRLGASKGQLIVPVAAPVFRDNVLSGALVASVNLHTLADRFLGLMKISGDAEIYLIDEGGTVLYSNLSAEAGESLFVPGDQSLMGNKELIDRIKTAFMINSGDQMRIEKHLVALVPVVLGDRDWLVITVSPDDNVTALVEPIYIRQTAILLLILFTFLLFGALTARSQPVVAQKRL